MQSSIEFLESKFQEYENWICGKHDAEQYTIFELFQDFKVAKKMHEKEVKNGYNQGYREALEDCPNGCIEDRDVAECSNADMYYEQYFEKNL
jgi:ferredoxin